VTEQCPSPSRELSRPCHSFQAIAWRRPMQQPSDGVQNIPPDWSRRSRAIVMDANSPWLCSVLVRSSAEDSPRSRTRQAPCPSVTGVLTLVSNCPRTGRDRERSGPFPAECSCNCLSKGVA
jgi:hypothetical protein